jgi:hypothetical protein
MLVRITATMRRHNLSLYGLERRTRATRFKVIPSDPVELNLKLNSEITTRACIAYLKDERVQKTIVLLEVVMQS